MNQAEQAAIISIMVFCGVVAVAHILAALYLLHRAEKKAESQQPKQGQDIPAKPEPLPNPVSVKDAKERKKRQKTRRQVDPEFRLRYVLRKRTRGILARVKVSKTWQKPIAFLGCTVSELRTHIEKQFEPWMSWDNHGQYGWHIDHVKPLSKYNLEDQEQFAEACHYTNLRPLHWQENLSKGAKECK